MASCSTTQKSQKPASDPFNFTPIESCNGEISKPELLNGREARKLGGYPEELRIEGVEGLVITAFQVGIEGNVNSVTTVISPDKRLTNISERVIKAYEFEVGTCDSTTVAFSGSARSTYRLSR